jgi:hypothetical protein
MAYFPIVLIVILLLYVFSYALAIVLWIISLNHDRNIIKVKIKQLRGWGFSDIYLKTIDQNHDPRYGQNKNGLTHDQKNLCR